MHEVTINEKIPSYIHISKTNTFYKLAGVVKGDTVHAIAIVPKDLVKDPTQYLECNDSRI